MNLVERITAMWDKCVNDSNLMVAMFVSIFVFSVLYYYMIKFLFDNESGALAMLFVSVMIIAR